MTAYIYTRCSHNDSLESGLGLADQLERCQRYFDYISTRPEYEGIELHPEPFVDEAVSAFQKKSRTLISRPAGSRLNQALKNGDHVIFARLDRAFRWLPDLVATKEVWDARGVGIHFVDMQIDMSTVTGKISAYMFGIIAQWYSEYISEVTKAALRQKKEREGSTSGAVAIGKQRIYSHDGSFVLAPDRKKEILMRWATAYRDSTGLSWGRIADHLEEIFAKKEGRKRKHPWYYAVKSNKIRRMYNRAKEQWPDRYKKN